MDIESAREKCYSADMLLKEAQKTASRSERRPMILAACDLYQEVLMDEDVDIPDPYIGLAYLIFSSGDKDQALELLDSAIALSSPTELRAQQVYNQIKRATPPQMPVQAQSINAVSSLRSAQKPVQNAPRMRDISQLTENLEIISFPPTQAPD